LFATGQMQMVQRGQRMGLSYAQRRRPGGVRPSGGY